MQLFTTIEFSVRLGIRLLVTSNIEENDSKLRHFPYDYQVCKYETGICL